MAKYLKKQKGSNNWQLSLKMPVELQNEKKTRLHRESLGTADLSRAKILRDQRIGELRTEWERQIAELNGEPFITREDLRKLVFKVIPPTNTQLISTGNIGVTPVRQTFAQLQEELLGVNEVIENNVQNYIEYEGVLLKSEDRSYLTRLARNYYSRIIQCEVDELLGKAPSLLPTLEDVSVDPESLEVQEWNTGIAGALTFPEAISKYKATDEWLAYSYGTKVDYKRSYDILMRCFSPLRVVGTLLPEDYERIRKIFMSMPKRMDETGDIDRLVANIPLEKRLAPRTVNKHFSAVVQLFKCLKKKGYIKTDMASSNLTAITVEDRYNPIPFDTQDLKKIVSPRTDDFMWWIPMIGMHTGARKNEICQLRPEDIVKEQGVWCFKITNQGEKNTAKTDASNRLVPIHSNLIKAGFLEFWKNEGQSNKNGRIFKEMKWSEHDKWVRPFNRNFDYRLKKLGVKPAFPDRKGFHGFRYLVTQKYKKAKAQGEFVDAVMGWTSMERREAEKAMRFLYEQRGQDYQFPIKKLQKTVELLKYDWLTAFLDTK